MNIDFFRKPFDQVEWDDIEGVLGRAESPHLEFKETLPQKEGNRDPWLSGATSLGRYARDQIAHEICAFANAYGGTLLLGVRDDGQRPPVAVAITPLPRCMLLAELLEQQIQSIIDPPLPGIQVRAVAQPGDDSGVLVVRVPASPAAPHGVGTPPAAYVRRGTSCMPMSMREIQSAFWDARTLKERVVAVRNRHSAELTSLRSRIRDSGFSQPLKGELAALGAKGTAFRISIIPHHAMAVGPLNPRSNWLEHLLPSPYSELGVQTAPAFDPSGQHYGWVIKAHGARCIQDGPSIWTISADGSVCLIGFEKADLARADGGLATVYPGHFAVSAAMALTVAERLRRRSGQSDVPLEVDCQFLNDGSLTADVGLRTRVPAPEPDVEIGPYLITTQASIPEVFRELQREIWAGFSIPFVRDENVQFQTAFKPGNWSTEH